ncbi:MAG: hypothetical protein RR162_00250 [Oscillospiraceae bacterium]
MYVLKLIKGLSCKAGTVRATKDEPEVEVEKKLDAENAVATGYFEIISSTPEDDGGGEADFEKMTEKQLVSYAAENGINLAGCSSKASKLAKILEPTATPNPGETPEGDGGGEADFGEDEA